MDLITGLRQRKTIRSFSQQAVPREVIMDILTDAHWAPSSSNQQPWHFHVVTGNVLDQLCEAIKTVHSDRKKSYDPSRGRTVPEMFTQRTKALFREMKPYIQSMQLDNRAFVEGGSFRFYEAPAVVFLNMHKQLPGSRLMDIGMAAENLMLSACARGLGTCAIALTLMYEDVIRQALSVSDEYNIVLSVAIGYPDQGSPINDFRSSRVDLSECVTWHGLPE